jgi:CheY-like chemotaxis protein
MHQKRVLIVEDEAHTATILYRALNDVFGPAHEAHICPLGPLAVSRLQQEAFDLIVTDLFMPGMTGLELIEEARRICPETPILVISAYGSLELEDRIGRLGVAFLAKPFSLREFVRTVSRMLEEAEDQD